MPCDALWLQLRNRDGSGYYFDTDCDHGPAARADARSEALAGWRRRPRMKQISFGAILIIAILSIFLTVPGQDTAADKYRRRSQALPSATGSPASSASPVTSSGDTASQGNDERHRQLYERRLQQRRLHARRLDQRRTSARIADRRRAAAERSHTIAASRRAAAQRTPSWRSHQRPSWQSSNRPSWQKR